MSIRIGTELLTLVPYWEWRELIAAKAECLHGEWLPWLEREFGWTDRHARRFMQVADAFGKSDNLSNLNELTIDASALYLLAKTQEREDCRRHVQQGCAVNALVLLDTGAHANDAEWARLGPRRSILFSMRH